MLNWRRFFSSLLFKVLHCLQRDPLGKCQKIGKSIPNFLTKSWRFWKIGFTLLVHIVFQWKTDRNMLYLHMYVLHRASDLWGFWLIVPQFCFLEVLRMSKWWCSILINLEKSAFLWQLGVTQHDQSCSSKYPFKREIR